MPFEDFDKKFREAADQHHPAYDENAWQKMQKLLDEHLPQPKKDRRRFLFFLLAFLVIGGGIWIVTSKPLQKSRSEVAQSTNKNRDSNAVERSKSNSADKATDGASPNKKTTNNPQESDQISTLKIDPKNISDNADKNLVIRRHAVRFDNKPQPADAKSPNNLPNAEEYDSKRLPANSPSSAAGENMPVIKSQRTPATEEKSGVKSGIEPQKDMAVEQQQQKPTTSAPGKSTSNGKRNRHKGLSFSLSAGPDVSQVGSEMGKLRLAYGLGIGYTTGRFTLRSGVYAARKVYSAEAKYYKLGYSLPATVTFESADANCYVLEVPLKVNYNFPINGNSNWFVSTGLSSYVMKEEKYVYNYKTSTGSYYTHQRNVANKNKHYFSVLDLSGGYTRQLSNVVSLTAEPYVQIPITGVGEGQVKLKSGGILFTIGVKPFKNF